MREVRFKSEGLGDEYFVLTPETQANNLILLFEVEFRCAEFSTSTDTTDDQWYVNRLLLFSLTA